MKKKLKEKKIKSVIYYICEKCNERRFDLFTTKLAKLLWFSDTSYFKKYGKSITEIYEYEKYEFGPFLSDFYDVLKNLENEGFIQSKGKYGGTLYNITNKDFDGDKLEYLEKEILNINIDKYGSLNSKSLSKTSHEYWWDFYEDKESIPVAARMVEKSKDISEKKIEDILFKKKCQ